MKSLIFYLEVATYLPCDNCNNRFTKFDLITVHFLYEAMLTVTYY